MALTYTFQPTNTYPTKVYPVFNDNTHLLTTDVVRDNFSVLSNVYINDTFAGKLKNFPFQGIIPVNPQSIAQAFTKNDYGFNIGVGQNCPNSINKLSMESFESYSRTLYYDSIASASGLIRLNLTEDHNVQNGDRVLIKQDNPLINPQYNGFAKVVGSALADKIVLDVDYVSTSATETGKVTEGVEYFDYGYISGKLNITTTNPHKLNVGSTFFLQMDTWAVAILKINSATTGSITAIEIDGLQVNINPIPFNTNVATTAADVATEINNSITDPNYTAYNFPTDDRVFIYSTRQAGTASVGFVVDVTSTGDFDIDYTPAMFNNAGIEPITNTGWNPQFTGTYQVLEVTSPTTFVCDLGAGFSNPPGSERGSIISLDNYISDTPTDSTEYWVLNNCNYYQNNDYSTLVNSKVAKTSTREFLTNLDNATPHKLSSLNDLLTVDILFNSTEATPILMALTVYYNDNTSTNYLINVSSVVTGLATSEYHKLRYGVGALNLNSISTSLITPTPVGQLINSNVVKYEFSLATIDTQITEKRTVTLECYPKDYFTLIFQNKWGSYDYFNLYANSSQKLNVDRQLYERKRESAYSASQYRANPEDRGNVVFDIQSNKEILLSTNWLTLAESKWLEEVYESPDVYLYSPKDYNGSLGVENFFPINIVDTGINLFNKNNGLKRMEFNAIFSNRRINQKQ